MKELTDAQRSWVEADDVTLKEWELRKVVNFLYEMQDLHLMAYWLVRTAYGCTPDEARTITNAMRRRGNNRLPLKKGNGLRLFV